MRAALMLGLVLLSGCGLSPTWNEWRAKQLEAQAPAREAEAQRLRAEEWQQIAYRNSPAGQAEQTCETKVAFAMAANPIRHSLDVAGVVRQQQLQAACMEHWRRTGSFP